jgi:uncharacterized protein YndB with AHSA1/START domain
MLIVLLYVLVVIALVLFLLFILAARRPDEFAVRRSMDMRAPPAKIFPLIDDFRQWPKWSPWEKLDPTMQRTLSGPAVGKGAVYEWDGDKKVGSGRMEILNSDPPQRVEIKLSFFRPWKAENLTTFQIVPSGAGSSVNWEMAGKNTLMFKVMGMLMNMDKMIGGDFEKGLAAMKSEVEREELPAPDQGQAPDQR